MGPKAESMQMSTAMNKCSLANLTQHSTARKQWRISLWSVQSCRHDRNTFSASPYQPASDRKPPRTERHQCRRGNRRRQGSPSIKPKLKTARGFESAGKPEVTYRARSRTGSPSL